jgi:hypothetical protein
MEVVLTSLFRKENEPLDRDLGLALDIFWELWAFSVTSVLEN